MAKKFSKDFRTATRTPSSRASKWASTWYVWSSGTTPFYGQPLDLDRSKLAIKGIWTRTPDISSRGSFRSSAWGRSNGSPQIFWTFFCHLIFPCRTVWVYLEWSQCDSKFWNGKKILKWFQDCHENALVQSFETSPHLICLECGSKTLLWPASGSGLD